VQIVRRGPVLLPLQQRRCYNGAVHKLPQVVAVNGYSAQDYLYGPEKRHLQLATCDCFRRVTDGRSYGYVTTSFADSLWQQSEVRKRN
jgi:hypothetical protein